ncbi:OsmC family protein [Pseudotenacibaculum sp. MALMAid0570]|uniref:OsmC family protein n=1 Tax=Pseudotenacibaculum sp. MALMAid0570 TaxID=3143938 RepID=UPI0032DEC1D4
MRNSIVYSKQQPLIDTYKEHPDKAMITDYAKVEGKHFKDPLHTSLILNDETQDRIDVGIHRAIGGLHDIANPGDILCGALASCFESTLRMIANRLGIQLLNTSIVAKAMVDVRGTLQMSKTVPVGFQKMTLEISINAHEDTKPYLISTLIKASEYSCVVYQTLKRALPIELKVLTEVSQKIIVKEI